MYVLTMNDNNVLFVLDLTDSMTVPNVWIKGSYIGGCYDGPKPGMGVVGLIDSGALKKMLA